MWEAFWVLVPLVLLAVAATSDLMTMTIPNFVTLALVSVFVPVAAASGLSWPTIGMHLLVGLIGFAVCAGLFYIGVFGGGDAKLIPGVLVWFGFPGVLAFLFWMALFGGLLAATILTLRRTVGVPAGAPEWAARLLSRDEGVPYGLAIAAGAAVAWGQTPLAAPWFVGLGL
jgi:prepilin peptidase CpaA